MVAKKFICALLAALLAALGTCASAEPLDAAQWLEMMSMPEAVDEMYTVDDFGVMENLPDKWLNVLLLGTDAKYTEYTRGEYGEADSMTLLSINLNARRVKLTSFVRDIWADIPGKGGGSRLSGATRTSGPALAMETLNDMFGMNIQYYALVNLSRMAEVIDLLGGLELDVSEEELHALNKGLFDLSPLSGIKPLDEYGSGVHVNGNQAIAYARIRNIDSDFRRADRQRIVLTTLARRLQQEDRGTIVGVVMTLMDCVETNLSFTQLMTIAGVGLQVDVDAIQQFCVPADNTYTTGSRNGAWAITADLDANKALLHRFIYG